MRISIVIPVYNEEENIRALHEELSDVLSTLAVSYEVIWVNDGSKDKSLSILEDITREDAHSKLIDFVYHFGQTAALSAGIKHATGEIIIPMDADLQNDPADIQAFLRKIEEGYDVVSGWRKKRKDAYFLRKIPSWIANACIRAITDVSVHDYGCSMKAYKKDIIQGVSLYGEMHRFIPAYAHWHGARVGEIVVNHRPRTGGKTKYGISRTYRVLLDLVLLKFFSTYMNRPMHFFGGIGFFMLTLATLALLWALYRKFFEGVSLIQTPLPVLSAMFVIVGVQLIVMGVIAEMIMRVYYESQQKTPYTIRRTINL